MEGMFPPIGASIVRRSVWLRLRESSVSSSASFTVVVERSAEEEARWDGLFVPGQQQLVDPFSRQPSREK
jgi:hypothetical protein